MDNILLLNGGTAFQVGGGGVMSVQLRGLEQLTPQIHCLRLRYWKWPQPRAEKTTDCW
jgi:hypothetical protein